MAENQPKPKEGSGHSGPAPRKRPRSGILVEPFRRRLYELIVRQLHHDGLVAAASVVADAASVCLGSTMSNGVDGDRLSRLAVNGLVVESLERREVEEGRMLNMVERYLNASKLYVPLHLSNAWEAGGKMSRWRQKFTTSPLGGVVRDLTFSEDGAFAACAGTNGLARVLALTTLEDMATVEQVHTANRLRGLDWTPESGKNIGFAKIQKVNEVTEMATARRLPVNAQTVEAIRFHPSKPLMLCGGITRDRKGELTIHQVVSPDVQLQTRVSDTFPIRTAAWHPSGEYVLFGTDHPAPRLLNVNSSTVLLAPQTTVRSSLDTSTATVPPVPAENPGRAPQQHSAGVTSVAFSPDGRTWASASLDGSWALCDGSSGKIIYKINGAHSKVPVTSLVYSRSGQVLLTSGMDSTARLWDLRYMTRQFNAAYSNSTGGHRGFGPAWAELMSFGAPGKCEHRSIRAVFTSDESHVLCQDTALTTINGYCVYSGDAVYTLAAPQMQRGLAVSPYGNTVLTGGDDCCLRFWAPSWIASS